MSKTFDTVVIGGGQAGLAAGYHLRRAGLDFVILDAGTAPGGAWQHAWDSLHLFSRRPTPRSRAGSCRPSRGSRSRKQDTSWSTSTDYEQRYELPVVRPVRVHAVHDEGELLRVEADSGTWHTRTVVSATGTWSRPFVPAVPAGGAFRGRLLHTVEYRTPQDFTGQRVVVVGGGNSGAQIAADLAYDTELTWATLREPRYLPDDIDGRALFDVATARRRALDDGRPDSGGVSSLGDIVAVPSVREARDAGLLKATPMFDRLTPTGVAWADGMTAEADTVIWCTGFRPAIIHLNPLALRTPDGRIPTDGTQSTADLRIHLLGYGDWTGRPRPPWWAWGARPATRPGA